MTRFITFGVLSQCWKFVFLGLVLFALFGCKAPTTTNAVKATCTLPVGATTQVPNSIIGLNPSYSRSDWPVANILDGDESSFMTTYTLNVGDRFDIEFYFMTPINLAGLSFVETYTGESELNMGSVTISVAQTGGNYEVLSFFESLGTTLVDSGSDIDLSLCGVERVKVSMQYNGSGAFGGSPSFYLSAHYA